MRIKENIICDMRRARNRRIAFILILLGITGDWGYSILYGFGRSVWLLPYNDPLPRQAKFVVFCGLFFGGLALLLYSKPNSIRPLPDLLKLTIKLGLLLILW